MISCPTGRAKYNYLHSSPSKDLMVSLLSVAFLNRQDHKGRQVIFQIAKGKSWRQNRFPGVLGALAV
jgi:hypothetical protein